MQLSEIMPDGKPWPSISIVTPSFNQANYLEATIRSVLLQGYPNLEYIVMDGGSDDGSLAIVRKYEPWLAHWESGPDSGQYAAIQKGFSLSHGAVMAWLNSDDLYFPWALRTVGEVFGEFYKVEWLSTSNIAATFEDSYNFGFSYIGGYTKHSYFDNRKFGEDKGFIQQESTFWRRNLWETAGGRLDVELRYAGDFELWARFYQHSNLVTTAVPLGIFRYHGTQKTRTIDGYLEEVRRVISKYPQSRKLPYIVTRALLFALRRVRRKRCESKNLLGRRGEFVQYDSKQGKWSHLSYWYL